MLHRLNQKARHHSGCSACALRSAVYCPARARTEFHGEERNRTRSHRLQAPLHHLQVEILHTRSADPGGSCSMLREDGPAFIDR